MPSQRQGKHGTFIWDMLGYAWSFEVCDLWIFMDIPFHYFILSEILETTTQRYTLTQQVEVSRTSGRSRQQATQLRPPSLRSKPSLVSPAHHATTMAAVTSS
jgi:hypothetical protein